MQLHSPIPILLLLLLMSFKVFILATSSVAEILGNETDRLSLLEFKRQIFEDPYGVLNSWNDSQHHCQWQGVICGKRHQRVTVVNLTGQNLFGSINPHIGNLSFLRFIQLNENRFRGEIPQDVGRLSRLKSLNLSINTITGKIPSNLSQCQELRVISLFKNELVGIIPPEIGSLKQLEFLRLHNNNLTGEIPRSFGNLSSLTRLSVADNHLEGSLPKEIGFISKLFFLGVGVNQFSGVITPEIYNISTLAFFAITSNMFEGTIPADLDLTLPNLQMLAFAMNKFTGTIPVSVTNMSKLTMLEVASNYLEGQVPSGLGNLQNLQIFNIGGNFLGNDSAGDLDFVASLTNCSNLQSLVFDQNNFGGKLPNVIGNLSSKLTIVVMPCNHISGLIPSGFGKLDNLFAIDLGKNSFTGAIPSDLFQLQNLQYLSLSQNLLSGQIPSNLCNITSLFGLYLSSNSFQGDISQNLQNCRYLKELNISQNNFTGVLSLQSFGMLSSPSLVLLSHNSLSGSLPLEVGKLRNLNLFDVSYNKFSGQIPSSMAGCSRLEYLNMQGNFFQGKIPPNFVSLKAIQQIDLSSNDLTGQVPSGLQNLTFLTYLNLSFNDLEGEIPTSGVFANVSQIFLVGNSKLCGGIPQLGLPPCLVKRRKKGHHHLIIIVTTSTIAATLMISAPFILCLVMYRKNDRDQESSTLLSDLGMPLRISYLDLYRSTEGFSSSNLIGSGSFGFVYKGRLMNHGDRVVAIKVLNIQKNGATKSFKAECKALANLRHRNLLPLLTCCVSIDSNGNEFKALVYEFMENGSLDIWLHHEASATTESRNLSLMQRLNIAIDVASALDYLHNHFELAIAHCDLKPSNVLLDHDLTAHVGDFGIARLLPKISKNSTQQVVSSSSVAVRGTTGYAAPEYAMGLEISTKGDVYSFGILLLEMFTGRKPTDDIFKDGLDLHEYVKNALPGQISEIVESSLLSTETEHLREGSGQTSAENHEGRDDDGIRIENMDIVECLILVFHVGLGCSQRLPKNRMDMKDVTRALHDIRYAHMSH